MKKSDKIFLEKLIKKYSSNENANIVYPLVSNKLLPKDIIDGASVLLTGNITMGEITRKFETEFAKFLGVKYALMVNSGSSANLLAFFALINPANKNRLSVNDECILPSLCWSTSLWPIIQSGLKPKFADVDLKTFNLDIKILKKKYNKKN